MSKTIAVCAEQYSLHRLNSKWKAVTLPVLPDSRRLAMEDCGNLFRYWVCDRDSSHEGVTRIGCKDPLCYVCSSVRTKMKVADKMELLDRTYEQLHEYVGCSGLTFTMPSDLWPKIPDEDIAVLERFVIEILTEYYGGERSVSVKGQKRLYRYVIGGDVAGQWFHSFKPWQKGNVWRGFSPHVHVAVYSVMYDRLMEVTTLNSVERGVFVLRRLGLSNAEVQKLRLELAAKWKECVEARYGKSRFQAVGKGPKGYASSWVVDYRYFQRRYDVEHWLDYMFRSEVKDAYREVVHNDSRPSSEGEWAWFKRMVSVRAKGVHRHSGFGWMANVNLNRYVKRLGIQFKPKVERDKERRRMPCYRCGGEMKSSWFDRVLTLEDVVSRGVPFLVSAGGGKNG